MSEVVKREGAWWIVGLPDVEDCGPYSIRTEADRGRRRLEKFFKCENRKGFVTSDPKQKGE